MKTELYLRQIASMVSCIQKEQKVLSEKLSTMDKALSKKYHEIEFTSFNASLGYKLASELQEILQARRLVKDEIALQQSLTRSLNLPELESSIRTVLTAMQKQNDKMNKTKPKRKAADVAK